MRIQELSIATDRKSIRTVRKSDCQKRSERALEFLRFLLESGQNSRLLERNQIGSAANQNKLSELARRIRAYAKLRVRQSKIQYNLKCNIIQIIHNTGGSLDRLSQIIYRTPPLSIVGM
jgi:hypothetical protein